MCVCVCVNTQCAGGNLSQFSPSSSVCVLAKFFFFCFVLFLRVLRERDFEIFLGTFLLFRLRTLSTFIKRKRTKVTERERREEREAG